MKKRIFAVVMAAVMTLSMVACGEQTGNDVTPTTAPTTAPTQAPVVDPEPTTAPAVATEATIDFEDGNYGFVMVRTKPRKADLSNLSLVDYNGSKAVFVENQGGAEMHVGIDVDAILGDKVTEVRKITMTVGETHPDGKFAAMSGYLAAFVGADLTETKLETWAVYMKNKNPKVVTFNLPEGTSFTAGNDNYITLVKDDDAGAALGSIYIDDICFYDAAGNLLKGDTTVVMEAPKDFLAVVEEEEPAANVVKVEGDSAYVGDWGQSAVVPADVLAQFAGKDVSVKVKFELTNDKDYYIWAPMDGAWGKLGTQVVLPAEAEGKYRAQEDGTIAIDDRTITELNLTLPAALVDTMIATGDGTFFGMVYGVVAYEIELSSAAATKIVEKVAGDESYVGDWGQSAVVPNEVLAKFAGKDVKVTVKYELTNDKDYYIWAPMNGSWEKLSTQLVLPAEAEGKYRAQEDGTIAIDDRTITELTFTIPAAVLDAILANADGTFFGMVYGVVAYEIVLEAEGAGTTVIKEKVAGDDSYKGDWAQSAVVPADVFAKFAGLDVDVTVKIELTNDKDYYIWAPMDGSWGKLGTQVVLPAEAEGKYHAQDDGTIALDDWTIGEIKLTLPAALVDTMIATGDGTFFGMVYGVTAYEIVLEAEVAAAEPVKEKVAGDDSYVGDWSQSAVVPADVFAKFAGMDVTVTAKIELTGDKDYYIWAPMNGNWEKLGTQVVLPAEAEGKYRAQDDGTIAIDDQTIGEIVITLPAALVDNMIANTDGTFFGMVYGVVAYEIVLEGTPAASAPAVDTPAVEEPTVEEPVEVTPVEVVDGKVTVTCDDAYKGDWGQSSVVPAEALAAFAGKAVKMTAKFELTGDKEYYIWAPMNTSWVKLGGAKLGLPTMSEDDGKAAGAQYFAKEDDVVLLLDWNLTEMTVTLPADVVDELTATGGFAAMTYGLIVKEIVLEAADGAAAEAPAAENLVINFADLTAGGYGYNAKVNDGAVDVTIASQYQEIQYILPEAVDLAAYKTLIVDVTSNAQLDIKLVDPNAEINEYSQKAPFRDNYTAEGQAITEPVYIDLAEYADKDLSQINFMAMGNDVAFTIKSITFVK